MEFDLIATPTFSALTELILNIAPHTSVVALWNITFDPAN